MEEAFVKYNPLVVGTWMVAAITVIVTILALTAGPGRAAEIIPAVTPEQAGASEKRLTLRNGRTVLCLVFASPPVASCDWSGSRELP